MPGELRVDTTPLATGGQGLLSAAGDIPEPPASFTATGTDALSTILNARTQAMEAPLIAGLPVTKADALRTAQNIIRAAARYEGVDINSLRTKCSRRWLNSKARKDRVLGERARRARPERRQRQLRRRPQGARNRRVSSVR